MSIPGGVSDFINYTENTMQLNIIIEKEIEKEILSHLMVVLITLAILISYNMVH